MFGAPRFGTSWEILRPKAPTEHTEETEPLGRRSCRTRPVHRSSKMQNRRPQARMDSSPASHEPHREPPELPGPGSVRFDSVIARHVEELVLLENWKHSIDRVPGLVRAVAMHDDRGAADCSQILGLTKVQLQCQRVESGIQGRDALRRVQNPRPAVDEGRLFQVVTATQLRPRHVPAAAGHGDYPAGLIEREEETAPSRSHPLLCPFDSHSPSALRNRKSNFTSPRLDLSCKRGGRD